MIDFLKLFVHVLVSPFKSQGRLEAEIVLLRHQLNVLRRRVSPKPKLTIADRLLFVWLYRRFPSVLSTVTMSGQTPSSDGTGLASACPGAGNHDLSAVDRRFCWRFAT
jgi:hypothetical protein